MKGMTAEEFQALYGVDPRTLNFVEPVKFLGELAEGFESPAEMRAAFSAAQEFPN